MLACWRHFSFARPDAAGITWRTIHPSQYSHGDCLDLDYQSFNSHSYLWLAYSLGAMLLGEPIIGLRAIGIILTDFTLWVTADGINPFTAHRHIFSWQAMAIGLFFYLRLQPVLYFGLAFRAF